MYKKVFTIPLLVAILLLNGVLLTTGSAKPPHPLIVMDGGIDNDRIAAPSGISASDGAFTDRISVNWNSVGGATYYEVYRSISPDSGTASLLSSPSSGPHEDTSANPGVYYYYWVKACDSTVCSSYSSSDQGYRALTPPASINASDGLYTDRVALTWTASDGASYYQIYRASTNNSGSASQINTTGSTSYDDASAGPGTLYYYWIKACATSGCSDFSNSDPGYRAITPPTAINASDGSYSDRIYISWNTTSGATSYDLYRNTTNSSGGATLLSGSIGSNSYNDTSATPGTIYYYWVKGCSTSGCSNFSSLDTGYRAITPPTSVSATDGTFTTKVDIFWGLSTGATYYEIWRNTSNNPGGASQLSGTPSSGPYSDTTAMPGIQYYYWVKGCVSTSCSYFSNYDTGFMGLTPPTGITASDGTYTNHVEISWNSSSGANYYQIWRNTSNSPGGASLLPASPTTSPHNDTTANPGEHYYYWVKACASVTGCSALSAYDDGYRAITPPTSNFASDGTYTDKVEISWSSSTGATFYQVWRNTSNTTAGASQLPGTPANSPYNDTTATPGSLYYYFVKGCNSIGCSDFSSSNPGYRAITPPTGVSATDGNHTDKVEISWSASTGATYYQVWINTSNTTAGASQLPGAPASSPYNDTTATPGTQYYYWVKGCSTSGCSDFSSSNPGYKAITPPTGVSATDGSHTDMVEISWSASTGATFYEVWRNTTSTTVGASQIPGTPATSPYNDTTATPGTQYYYFVKGCSTSGCSDFSSSNPGYRAISAPTGLSASDGMYIDKVETSWSPSTGATYYDIYRNTTNSTDGASQLPGAPTNSPYDDTTATPGSLYYYFVKGCNTIGCSGYSASNSGYRAITPPTGVSASNGMYTDRVEISWSTSIGAMYYTVWRNTTDTTAGASQLPGTPASSPYNDTTATPGILYYYFVRGCSTSGCSDFSNSDSGYQAITPPSGVSATDGTYTSHVQISWSASTGATFYEVFRNTSNTTTGASKLAGAPTSSPYNYATVPGRVYYFWVKGCNTNGCSDFSNSDAGYQAITPPTGVSASDGTYTDKVEISWSASTGATYYEIWRNSTDSPGSASKLSGDPASSPYSDTTAVPGTVYYYWVKGCSTSSCSAFSSSKTGYRAITPPTGVSASDGTHTDKLEISWSSSTGATYYEIWRNVTDSPGSASKLSGDPASSPYSDTTATPGTVYYYWVKGCTPSNCSAFSSSDFGYRAITPPTDVSASDGTYTDKVEISWSASTGATFYTVWRNTTYSSAEAIDLGGTPVNSPYSDTTADPGTQYFYWVKACSSPTTCSGFSELDTGHREFMPPTAVSASDGTYLDRVEISWSSCENVFDHEIWRNTSDDSGTASNLGIYHPTSPYSDPTAIPGTQYYYWVKACSLFTCSDFSASDGGYAALPAPTSLDASNGTYTDKVVISWTAIPGATYYEVWRLESARSGGEINALAEKLPGEPTASPYDDTSAIPGIMYTYWVKACSEVGCSDYSDGVQGFRDIAMDHKAYLPLILK